MADNTRLTLSALFACAVAFGVLWWQGTWPFGERVQGDEAAQGEPSLFTKEQQAQMSARADAVASQQAKEAIQGLGIDLKKALKGKLQEGGPVAALDYCSEAAPGMPALHGGDGVTVGRTSTKLRNPNNAGPEWAIAYMKELEAQAPEQRKSYDMVVDTPDGRVARVAKPLPIAAPCLLCHGEELTPEVQAALAAKYPSDHATGYKPGDIRGVIYAEAKVTN